MEIVTPEAKRPAPDLSPPRPSDAEKHKTWDRFIRLRGSRYEDCRLETFSCETDDMTAAREKLTAFASGLPEGIDRNVILLGPSGTGKDHLLTGCVRRAISAGVKSVGWTSGPELFAAMREGIAENRSENEAIKPLTGCKILVFSDLAMTTLSDYQREIVYRIIDHRYNNRKATWISANVSGREAFEKATSPQIVDRLIDGAVYVPCNWPSYRKVQQ